MGITHLQWKEVYQTTGLDLLDTLYYFDKIIEKVDVIFILRLFEVLRDLCHDLWSNKNTIGGCEPRPAFSDIFCLCFLNSLWPIRDRLTAKYMDESQNYYYYKSPGNVYTSYQHKKLLFRL